MSASSHIPRITPIDTGLISSGTGRINATAASRPLMISSVASCSIRAISRRVPALLPMPRPLSDISGMGRNVASSYPQLQPG